MLDVPHDRLVADLRLDVVHMAEFGVFSEGNRAALLHHFTNERAQRILDGIDG